MKKNSNRFVALVMALVMLVLTPMSALAEAADTGISTPTDTTAVVQQPTSGDPEPSTEPEPSQEPAPTQEPVQSPDPVPSQEPETSQEPDPTPATSPNMSNPAKQTDGRSVSNQPVVLGAALGNPAPASVGTPSYTPWLEKDGSLSMALGETKTIYTNVDLSTSHSNENALEITGGKVADGENDEAIYEFRLKAKYPTTVEWWNPAAKVQIIYSSHEIINKDIDDFSVVTIPDSVKDLKVGESATMYSLVQLTVPASVDAIADVTQTQQTDGVWKIDVTATAAGNTSWNEWGLSFTKPKFTVKYGDKTQEQLLDEEVKAPGDVWVDKTKDGKYFVYWEDADHNRVDVGTKITGNLELTPVYAYPTVTIDVVHKYKQGDNWFVEVKDADGQPVKNTVTIASDATSRTADLSSLVVSDDNYGFANVEARDGNDQNRQFSVPELKLDTTAAIVKEDGTAAINVTLYYDAYVTNYYAVDLDAARNDENWKAMEDKLPGLVRTFKNPNGELLMGDPNFTVLQPRKVKLAEALQPSNTALSNISQGDIRANAQLYDASGEPAAYAYQNPNGEKINGAFDASELVPGAKVFLTYKYHNVTDYSRFDISPTYLNGVNDKSEDPKSWETLLSDSQIYAYYGETISFSFADSIWKTVAAEGSCALQQYADNDTTFNLWKYSPYVSNISKPAVSTMVANPTTYPDASVQFTYTGNVDDNGQKERQWRIQLFYRDNEPGAVDPTITVTYKPEDSAMGSVDPTSNTGVSATTPVTGTQAGQVSGSTATANPGYDFVGWYKEISAGVLAENAITTNANLTDALAKENLNKDATNDNLYADTTYVAKFAPKTIKVEYKVEGEGGSVNHASDTASKISGNVVNGSTATPADGYEFDGWYKGNALITTEKTLSAGDSHTNLNKDANNDNLYADTTYVAKFKEKTIKVEYKVEGEGGSVNHDKDTASKITGNVVNGSTATPADGYEFDGWYKGDTLITTEKTLSAGDSHTNLNKDANNDNLYADTTYVAKFKVKVTPPPKPSDAPTPSPTPKQTPEAPTPSPTPEQTPEAPTPSPTPEQTPEAPTPSPTPEQTPEAPTEEPTPSTTPVQTTETPTETPTKAPDPQPVRPRPTATPVPEEEQPEPTEEPTPEPVKYRVTVNYWFEKVGGVPAGLPFSNVYATGDAYKVVSRKIPGWDVDKAEVSGVMAQEDVVVDVVYTMQEHTLTIHYIYADGTEAAPSVTKTLKPGDSYSVASPEIEGTLASRKTVAGLMPAWDMTATVIYIKPILPNPDRTRTGTNLFIIEDYETPLGIGNVNLNAGECFE